MSCQHETPCPAATAPDAGAAHVVVEHFEQGWVLLCNGAVRFDDDALILPTHVLAAA